MRVFHDLSDYKPQKPTVLTIGTFDGVHIGHQKIIERLIRSALSEEADSVMLTFFPHPRMVLGQGDIKLLNSIEEKQELLKQLGLDVLLIHPFDKAFSELSAEDFVKNILVEGLKLKRIIIGYDHRFGKNRTAGIEELIYFGKQYGFEVEQISVQEIDEVSVSSTKIRTALIEGAIALANSYLGYAYKLEGKVVKGNQLGRTIGFPTANLEVVPDYKLIPRNGVYVIEGVVEGKALKGMMNIGVRPTIDGLSQVIEAHFFDFDQDIYGKTIQVKLLDKIRDEQKFDSLEALKERLRQDQKISKTYFGIL